MTTYSTTLVLDDCERMFLEELLEGILERQDYDNATVSLILAKLQNAEMDLDSDNNFWE